jgi:hypothetical protein
MSILKKILLILGISGTAMTNATEPKIVSDAKASAEWISNALTSSGYKADFSIESLKEIDRFIEEHAPNGKPVPGGLLSESAGSRLFAVGSYVGEVIRRQYGGTWSGNDKDPEAEINIELKLKSGTVLWPVQRVLKRFKNGSAEGIYAYGVAAKSY